MERDGVDPVPESTCWSLGARDAAVPRNGIPALAEAPVGRVVAGILQAFPFDSFPSGTQIETQSYLPSLSSAQECLFFIELAY